MNEKEYFEMITNTCGKCEYYDKENDWCKVCFCNDELCEIQEKWLKK